MDEKKKTNIIALTDFTEIGNSAVRHAATLALVFKSSLTIVHRFGFRTTHISNPTENDDFKQIIAAFSDKVSITVSNHPFLPHLLHHYAEQTNTIMFVIGVSRKNGETFFNRRRALKFIAPSRLPVMTVGASGPIDPQWLNVLVTLDIYRQEKEKALWSGYFNRYGGATVHVLHTTYKDEFLREKLRDNLEFTDKLYSNLEIQAEKHEIPKAGDLDAYALRHAADYHGCLLVVMTTTYKSVIDILFGTREKHLIANRFGIPILCLNERDDLYVLCT